MNRRYFLYRMCVSGILAGLFCEQAFGNVADNPSAWKHVDTLYLTTDDQKIIAACLSMGRCRILAGGAVACLSGMSAFTLPLCLVNDNIEAIGAELRRIHGTKVVSNLLKGLDCLDVVFGNKHYPIRLVSEPYHFYFLG